MESMGVMLRNTAPIMNMICSLQVPEFVNHRIELVDVDGSRLHSVINNSYKLYDGVLIQNKGMKVQRLEGEIEIDLKRR